jgi:hypothetical protein
MCEGRCSLNDVLFWGDGKRLYLARGGVVEVRDVATLALTHLLTGHRGDICDMALSEEQLATSGDDTTVLLWDLEGLPVAALQPPPAVTVTPADPETGRVATPPCPPTGLPAEGSQLKCDDAPGRRRVHWFWSDGCYASCEYPAAVDSHIDEVGDNHERSLRRVLPEQLRTRCQ